MIKKALLLLIGIFVWVMAWFIIPTILISLNLVLGLPFFLNTSISALGLVLFTLGLALTLFTINDHFLTGRATPVVVESPKKFIAEGLYKYSRNPMYIGMIITFFALFMLFGGILLLFYALGSIIALHLLVVYFEEPQLKKIFGKTYTDYQKKVPRWLPKFT